MSDDYLAVLVWILRMVLPCILFWISFGPRLRTFWQHPAVPKNLMLIHREIVSAADDGPPEALSNLMMVDAQTAPMLFQEVKRPRERSDRADRGERGERPERGDRGDRGERGERGDRPSNRRPGADRRRPSSPDPADLELERIQNEAHMEEERRRQAADNQMHLESLVNFVAFSRREQQRVFLPDSFSVPPPPPKKVEKAPKPSPPQESDGPSAAVQRANAEAQMVLRGALKTTSACGVVAARALNDQLTELGIEIMPLTFELIVETCIQANQLKFASNFLMKMEEAGQTPTSELLDRVMELYLEHKRAAPEDPIEPPRESHLTKRAPGDNSAPGENEAHHGAGLGAGNAVGGHILDVAGLKRLVVQPPPPPPLPPAPVTVPGVYGHPHPVPEYNHIMNHVGWAEMPSILLPTHWQPRSMMPNRTLPRSSEGRESDRGKHLPAFSVPDEFAEKQLPAFCIPDEFAAKAPEAEKEADSTDAAPADDAEPMECDQVAATSSTAPADDVGTSATESSSSKGKLSVHAAEFVPGCGAKASTVGRPSLTQMVGPPSPGIIDYSGPLYPSVAEFYNAGEAVDDDWGIHEETASSQLFVPALHAAAVDAGFEFSASAAVFTPMGATQQAQSVGGLRHVASQFGPGTNHEPSHEADMVFANGMRGHVASLPLSHSRQPGTQMHGDPRLGSEEEQWHDGNNFEVEGDFQGRPQPQPRGQHPSGRQTAAGGRGNGQGGSTRLATDALAAALGQSLRNPGRGRSGHGSGEFAEPLPPGPRFIG